jgi:hypothetical protein
MFVFITSKKQWINLHYLLRIEEVEKDSEERVTIARVTQSDGYAYVITDREDISALLSAAAGFGKPARPSL